MKKINKELKCFIEEERWEYPFELTSDTDLEKDMKITGDEAIEFIVAFGKRFNVDISKFEITSYFNEEGLDSIGFIKKIFDKQKKEQKALTLGNLENAMNTKMLI